MMVQSPLKRRNVQPNLRKVSKPEKMSAPTSTKKATAKKSMVDDGVGSGFAALKPGTMMLIALVLGAIGFAYITHVFATQQLLGQVQQLEAEYNKARQQHDELKLQYDRLVGPAEIYEKAKQQGFVNGGPADHVLILEK